MQMRNLVTTALLAGPVSAAALNPVVPRGGNSTSAKPTFYNGTCTAETVTIRKEWRSLTTDEKSAYIGAVQCLMDLPPQTTLQNVTSRFTDFQASHQFYTGTEYGDIIHYTGQFLPWHRLMLYAYEKSLREQCNYTGTMPWWDEQLDADSGDFFQSNMWDPVTGFGGNGSEPDGCLREGPFANMTEYIGPMLEHTEYCMARNWDPETGIVNGDSAIINFCNNMEYYSDFFYCIAVYPHHGGHEAVRGLMGDRDASPGEPLFYLHHAYIDRLWWQWQQADGDNRLYQMNGNTVNQTANVEPAGGWVEATLDYVLEINDIVPNEPIETVMNAQGGFLCYEYEY